VSRRFNELEAAELQREAYRAAGMRNWTKLARMLDALELRAQDNPWLMQTVSVLRELLAQRDQARLEKELMYSSHSLSSRLTEQDELLSFSQQRESEKGGVLAPQGAAGAGFKLLSRLGRVVRLGIDCGLRVCMGRAGQWQ
jgi:hypothetical protein